MGRRPPDPHTPDRPDIRPGQWDCHGRLYGWWQSLPKDRRRELLINDEVCIEPDFAMLHPSLLYAAVGATMPRDVYETGEHLRDHGKLALNIGLNAKGAVDALMWRKDWTGTRAYTQGLVDAIADLNRPIAQFIGSDAGIRLMGIDSAMAVGVMKRCRKAGIDVLPVHDSFVAPEKHQGQVEAIMAEVLDDARTMISQGTSKTSIKIIPHTPLGAAAPRRRLSPLPFRLPALPPPPSLLGRRLAPRLPEEAFPAPPRPLSRPRLVRSCPSLERLCRPP